MMVIYDDIWNDYLKLKSVNDNDNTNNNNNICDLCGIEYVEIDGQLVCTECGYTCTNTIVDPRSDVQLYPDSKPGQERTSRVNPLKPSSSVGSWAGRMQKGKKPPSWLCRQHWEQIPGTESRQKEVFRELDETCNKIGIPGMVADAAKFYYKLVADYRIGRLVSMRVSCLYYACKEYKIPRDGGQLAKIMGYNPKQLTETNKIFLRILRSLKGKPNGYMTIGSCTFPANTADEYVNYYSYKLGLPFSMNHEIKLIIENVKRIGLISDKSPIAKTAACTYFAINEYGIKGIDKNKVGEVFNLSLTTFNSACNILHKYHFLLFLETSEFEKLILK